MNDCGTVMVFQDRFMTQFFIIPNSDLLLNVKLLTFNCKGVVDNQFSLV